jgi:hypothetical protein
MPLNFFISTILTATRGIRLKSNKNINLNKYFINILYMILQIFTQINCPILSDCYSIWIPCLRSESVEIDPIKTQKIFITHINAVEYCNQDLHGYKIYCIGPITESRLRSQGYLVERLADRASEVILPNEPITWLHGDTYSRDFSNHPNLISLQAYKTIVDEEAIDKLIYLEYKFLHIYSPKIIKAYESRCPTRKIHLYYTDSCKPNPNLYASITRFYPSTDKYL